MTRIFSFSVALLLIVGLSFSGSLDVTSSSTAVAAQNNGSVCTVMTSGTCTDAGCIGGPDQCFTPPTGGMCWTTTDKVIEDE